MELLRAIAALNLLVMPISSCACSLAGCRDHGAEFRSDFVIEVKHQGRPLAGVTVAITGNGVSNELRTGADGTVHVSKLQAGDYWLNAELLGISADSECFHVSLQPSRKARKKLHLEWGDLAPATRQIAGRLQVTELGKSTNFIWNVQHREVVPIKNVSLTLRSPIDGSDYHAVSDSEGRFLFREIPPGTYVLHIEGIASPGGYAFDSDDLLLDLTATAKANSLLMTPNLGGGSCGGWSLALN